MAALSVHVHPHARIVWQPISQLVGVLGIQAATGDNGKPEQVYGLAFSDPDGEIHVYVFTEDGKRNLIGQLTGGLVIPGGG